MALLSRRLATGHWMVFDKETRELYLAEPGSKCDDLETAKRLVADNKAKKFDKGQLQILQTALNEVVLLGGTT